MYACYGGKPIIYLIYISTVIYYFKDYLKDIEAAIEKTQKIKTELISNLFS